MNLEKSYTKNNYLNITYRCAHQFYLHIILYLTIYRFQVHTMC